MGRKINREDLENRKLLRKLDIESRAKFGFKFQKLPVAKMSLVRKEFNEGSLRRANFERERIRLKRQGKKFFS